MNLKDLNKLVASKRDYKKVYAKRVYVPAKRNIFKEMGIRVVG